MSALYGDFSRDSLAIQTIRNTEVSIELSGVQISSGLRSGTYKIYGWTSDSVISCTRQTFEFQVSENIYYEFIYFVGTNF